MYTLEFRLGKSEAKGNWHPRDHKPLKFLCNAALLVRQMKMFYPDVEWRIAPDSESIEAEKIAAENYQRRERFKFTYGEAA